MSFFKKKSVGDWENIEDSEIDQILTELESLPSLSSINDHLKEFSNALIALKKNKKPSLVQAVFARARHLSDVLNSLKEAFGDIAAESEKINEIDMYVRENFFTLL